MPRPRTAKLFGDGASQAVRLPAEFRFPGDEVFVSRDVATGDVVLSQGPSPARTWHDFFALLGETEVPSDFMASRPMNLGADDRILLEEEC